MQKVKGGTVGLNIVITMAGLGSRFRKAGYTVPKFMIEAKGKSLFEWSMISLQGFLAPENKYFFVVREDDKAKAFIEEKGRALGFSDINVIEIGYVTKGQAESVMLASPYWDPDDELLIYNIDTYIEAGEMNSRQLKGDGFIPCFQGEGDHWSFVRLNEAGEAVEIREKKRISDYCTVGAYYFHTAALFEELYQELYVEKQYTEAGEQYVAPMYDLLLKKGGKIYISDIPKEKVHVLGTPEELEVFLNS